MNSTSNELKFESDEKDFNEELGMYICCSLKVLSTDMTLKGN